jgi:3',5'-cyclic AMP phosphodiesterase CpdA
VATRALHVSDLHTGRNDTSGLGAALVALADETAPELVLATGDLAHRGRAAELQRSRALLEGAGKPLLVVPGNHDIPYTFPARFSRPWRAFEAAFGDTDPVYRSETLVVCGLNSVRPWRHQGGRLSSSRVAAAAEHLRDCPEGALRIVALHHHLAGAPWRAARKLPLKRREQMLAALTGAGADLIVGGHIHQASVTVRGEFDAHAEGEGRGVVLATAPGLGRPRPHRPGEAQGALVYEWDASVLTVRTFSLDGERFTQTAERTFPRVSRPAGRSGAPRSADTR